MHSDDCNKIWNPCKELFLENKKNNNYAIIILNTPIDFKSKPDFLINLWKRATVRVTVDGGTNKWLSWLKLNNLNIKEVPYPDLITGDMDSISNEIYNYFRNTSTAIVKTPNQDDTDFTKALRQLQKYINIQKLEINIVYVIVDTSGRFDQILGNINTLYKARNILPNIELFQVSSDSLTWLLEKGTHKIFIPYLLRQDQKWCALIPIGKSSIVSTEGLKWNLDNKEMEFGSMISTSNTYSGLSEVKIKTNNTILWSMSLESLLKDL